MAPQTGRDPRARDGPDLRPEPALRHGAGRPRQPCGQRRLRARLDEQGDDHGRRRRPEEGRTARRGSWCPAPMQVSDHLFHDSEPHGTERLTLAGILAKSSNIGTIKVGAADRRPDVVLVPEEVRCRRADRAALPGREPGGIPAPRQWSGTQRSPIAFGQGLSVTAVQMAGVYADHRQRRRTGRPDARAGLRPRRRHGRSRRPRPRSSRVVSAETAEHLRTMLEGVVSEERHRAAGRDPDGYRVAGKTGTAQRVDPTCGCYRGYTSSFIGMAPADKPAAGRRGHAAATRSGATTAASLAAPVFKQVMTFALQQLRIPPTGTTRAASCGSPGERR